MNASLGKFPLSLSHCPSVLLIIGYVFYWIELYFIRLGRGRTSLLATVLFICYLVLAILNAKSNIRRTLQYLESILKGRGTEKYFCIASLTIILVMVLFVLNVLTLPPHLPQEYDSLNYHVTIPKQHIIAGTFKHILWSAADLRLMPLEVSLSPYWLATSLPNKLPQILFLFGIIACAISLTRKINKDSKTAPLLTVIAILASHNFGIQMGILMLDLAICYLFIACIDSFMRNRIILGAIEAAFFIWSKPFSPIFILATAVIVFFAGYFLVNHLGYKIYLGFDDKKEEFAGFTPAYFKKSMVYVLLASIFVAGPFVLKSLYYSGTPLFPFFPGSTNIFGIDKTTAHWQSIISTSKVTLYAKDVYGSGRGILDFLKHFWLLAVPEKGVMNRYDYPLGLPYLLFMGPFLYFAARAFFRKRFAILPVLAIVYWSLWWFGSQQSRFLFIPLVLIFVTVSASIRPAPALFSSLFIALLFNSISVFRAHYRDISAPLSKVLRDKDNKLIQMNKEYYVSGRNDTVTLDFIDFAYADFPVKVVVTDQTEEEEYWFLNE